jgi:glutathione S-transferase
VRRAGGRGTTPALVVDGRAIDDSTDILRWVQGQGAARWAPYPPAVAAEALTWEERFDADIGPHSRRFAYHHILPHKPLAVACLTAGVPGWQATWVSVFFPLLRWMFRKGLRIDAPGAARSRERILRTFDAVAEARADGRPFLTGDTFTAADLTFAALSGPIVLAPEYGPPLPPFAELPADLQAAIAEFRAHPAGAWALHLYATERAHRP